MAVAVTVLAPACSAMPDADHVPVSRPVRTRVAEPLVPNVVFDQITRETARLSEASPPSASVPCASGFGCPLISTSGAVESTVLRRNLSAWLIVASSATAEAVTSVEAAVLVSLLLLPLLPPPQAVRAAANRTESEVGTERLR
jgi:hypothetical protein